MGVDLTVRSHTYGTENQSWLGSEHGTDCADGVTLDGALMGAIFTDGVVPSGVVLGVVTATGRYTVYNAAGVAGEAVARGHLLTTVELNRPLLGDAATVFHNTGGALYWHGEVIESKLPTGSGIDGAAKTSLPLIHYI